MIYQISFEESHNYNTTERLYRSVTVEAPPYLRREAGVVLPDGLMDWAKVWAGQFGLTGELEIQHYTPTQVIEAKLAYPAGSLRLLSLQI